MLITRLLLFYIMLAASVANALEILNVSYDTTRSVYNQINQEFLEQNPGLKIYQSHGGSTKQTKMILFGLKADIFAPASSYDVERLVKQNLVAKNWRSLYENNSSPMSSKIVFLVRTGNKKNIHDWGDLVKDNILITAANPKISGGGVSSYFAALSYADNNFKSQQEIYKFLSLLFSKVQVFDSSARNSAVTFTERKVGDVLLTWESDAKYIAKKLYPGEYEVIYPSITLKVNMPVVAILNDKKNIFASKYIDFLFSKRGQQIISENYFTPVKNRLDDDHNVSSRSIDLEDMGDFNELMITHFQNGGVFDQIYKNMKQE